MDIAVFFQCLFNGLAIGGIYALVAAGFTLVLGTMKIFNFAQGEIYMLGAFVSYWCVEVLHLHYALAVLASFLAMALLGVILQRFIIRYTYGGFFHTVLATIAFATLVRQTAVITFGKTDRFMNPVVRGRLEMGDIMIPNEKILLIFLGIVMILLLHYFMKLKVGKAMRAVTEDQEVAGLQGINSRKIFIITMALGCGLAGISGAIIAPVLGATADMGHGIFIKILLVIIIGGMGSMPGALLAAFLIGQIESFGYQFVGGHNELLLLCCLIPILFLRPGGLLGKPLAIPE
ncbi:MAG: branched-chain amino acid ABC transporter permease [Deltaproteobacteria bacterium]|nr:branched-chain amino acid ABC transporter permease [Deltaproteobacteria bacterium]MBW2207111.1 branched-chain amino acid ABC transporter permease [Deltaproteobacteria bacterium]